MSELVAVSERLSTNAMGVSGCDPIMHLRSVRQEEMDGKDRSSLYFVGSLTVKKVDS